MATLEEFLASLKEGIRAYFALLNEVKFPLPKYLG